jgi:hypothetical protein
VDVYPGFNGAKLRCGWDGFAPEGLQDSAQGFNPGNRHPDRFALTRHMNVRSMNNTRSSGLEMLKGRQIRRTNNVKALMPLRGGAPSASLDSDDRRLIGLISIFL